MLRLKLMQMLPFLNRWMAIAPTNCCGTCPTCIGTTVTGLVLPMVASRRDDD